jgi:hypothetical protein
MGLERRHAEAEANRPMVLIGEIDQILPKFIEKRPGTRKVGFRKQNCELVTT